MGRKTIHLKSKERRGRSDLAAFFRELADKIERNDVVLQQGTDEVRLDLPESVEFEVEVEEKEKRSGSEFEIELEIEWHEQEKKDEQVSLG